MPAGIVSSSFSPTAAIKLQEYTLLFPLAADVDYFSTNGTDGSGSQGAMDISASTAGTAVKRSASGTKPIAGGARLPTITATDASGTTLAVTVRIIGRRFGRTITQDLVAAAGVGTQTITGTHCIDELVSATITSIAANTTSDTLSVGFNGNRIGLPMPIKNRRSVKYLEKIASSARTASGANVIATATLQASSSPIVYPTDSSIDCNQAFSGAVAATDIYQVRFMPDGADDLGPNGYLA